MRISRLDLLRYGKFTDKSVLFPAAKQDFHLVVGPNEAGKSTLRNAMQDLLFGIETRSAYNFLHPHNEMRLGALVEQSEAKLDFIRIKARNNTLRTPQDGPLSDSALATYLGQVDRDFFGQMFGLNHERLEQGGRDILSASNDVGRILFQAAAGISSLGEIRDRLDDEASKLWAKRKSGDRAYYIAADQLDAAESALKQALVRTKDWQEAKNRLDELNLHLNEARQRYQHLETERIRLERVRRIAPMLAALRDLESQLEGMGKVTLLPENAGQQFEGNQQEIAIATQARNLYQQQLLELQTKLDALVMSPVLLAREVDIEELSALRQQLRAHESDIDKREEEVRVLFQDVLSVCRQLGWAVTSETEVAEKLPGGLSRAALDGFLRRREGVEQAARATAETLALRREEIKTVTAEMAALHVQEIPVELLDALTKARAIGDVDVQQQQLNAQVTKLERELQASMGKLGAWTLPMDQLRAVSLPSVEEVSALMAQRNKTSTAAETQEARLEEIRSELNALQLEINQYKSAHHPVTLEEVLSARTARDAVWQAIKGGKSNLMAEATAYEQQVQQADGLSDQRHDKAQEESELQAKINRLAHLQLQLQDIEAKLDKSHQALADFDQKWSATVKALGLEGISLQQITDWRVARERTLSIAIDLADAKASKAEFEARVSAITLALSAVLRNQLPQANQMAYSTLVLHAEQSVAEATRGQERHDALTAQKIRAEATLPELSKKAEQSHSAFEAWRAEMRQQLASAHLPEDANPDVVEGALKLFLRIEQQLEKIRELRVNRIEMMRADLKEFARQAKSLSEALSPELSNLPTAEITKILKERLTSAKSISQEHARLEADRSSLSANLNQANARISGARAALEPLLHAAGANDDEELREAIVRSDRNRTLTEQADTQARQMLQAGDGLGRPALETEAEGMVIDAIPARIAEIQFDLDNLVAEQNKYSGELTVAEADFTKIAGQADAAKAESQRQEALAGMANAAERYVKVYTAARLLRWAIDRFRERRQGPMLARASEIFNGLTQDAFSRLVVDYESEPCRLSGLRSGGGHVEIEGMSEGTRDQLYLALRLAALELHLENSATLPFIADDLFINYDDGRAQAGLKALAKLSEMTQVVFLTHHEHLVPVAQTVFGEKMTVISLS
jgi:uncharacterized protein YhaN